ncbi:MAG: amidohydrolase [Ignavibacteriales bacterium CG_4_9_14_3_um_filter_30_11]|nr:MAG: amidohydrolase [Ignavibacteriales bacterium CG_4_9_14_3_um_filter_30_11]
MKKIILYIIATIIINSSIVFPQFERSAFINGKIYTVNEKQPFAEAVVIEGNKILFVGSNIEAKEFITSETKVTDLQGKLMVPGFIDDHAHFTNGGFYLLGLDLSKTSSVKEFEETLKDYISTRKGRWITGGRWDHEKWDVKEIPTKEMIDNFSKETPVFISRYDGHMGLANSVALKLAEITKDTKSPEGGLIVKDKVTGEPTGILKDNAMDLISIIIPEPSKQEYIEAVEAALKYAREVGVTTVEDITFPNDLSAYQEIEKDGNLTCRIYTHLPIDDYKNLVNLNIQHNFGGDKIQLGALKAYADGSLGSTTAWFFNPYKQDTTTTGLPNDIITDGRFKKWAFEIDKNKLQICVHAIGNKANSYILDVYSEIKNNNPVWDRRFRIEHAQHIIKEDIKRFKDIGVIASVQPEHLLDDGIWVSKRIGDERAKLTHIYKSLIDEGVVVAFGTDWPVVDLNPMLGLYAAVTRRTDDGKNPNGWLPEQKLTIEQAIKCYTLNSAYAAFQENVKGSIEVGKLADMIVLNDNLLTIDPVKIKDVKVDMTIFDGKVIYERK